jgi:glyoxylase I family protein
MDLHHIALPVVDLERSKRFYEHVLGLREMPRPAAFDFAGAWYALGTGQLHLIVRDGATMRGEKPVDSRDVHFAIRVADYDAMLDRLHDAGYREDAPPEDPLRLKANRITNAGFSQIFVLDPDHHVIELNTAPATPR